MQEESQIHQNQPTPATSFKLKNFIQLITSVNPKKSLFALGLFLSLLTSGASLIVPQLTKNWSILVAPQLLVPIWSSF